MPGAALFLLFESNIPALEERYEHDRADIFRMAESCASTATGVESRVMTRPASGF